MADLSCPICGSISIDQPGASLYVAVAQCEHCSHLFAHGMPTDHGVQTRDAFGDIDLFAERDRRLARWLVRRGFVSDGSTLLDIGTGTGHILDALERELAVEITCVEPDPGMRSALVGAGRRAAPSLDDVGGRFHSILLIEVLEHVPDPVELLRGCASRLAPGGIVFVTTPIGQLRGGSRSTTAYDTPEHVHFFTETSFLAAIEKAGLVTDGVVTVNAMYPYSRGTAGRVKGLVKDTLRPVRARLTGPRHLVAFLHG